MRRTQINTTNENSGIVDDFLQLFSQSFVFIFVAFSSYIFLLVIKHYSSKRIESPIRKCSTEKNAG